MSVRRTCALGTALIGLTVAGSAVAGTYNLEYQHVPGELIVRFAGKPAIEAVQTRLAAFGGKAQHQYRASGAYLVRFAEKADGKALTELASSLAARPDVANVEANTILHADGVTPNDPQFASLYGLNNTGANGGTAGADIHAVDAWSVTTGSKSVLVGVIDTGVDYTHPDIAPNYWTNPGESGLDAQGKDKSTNGIDDDGNGFVDDFRGWNFVANTNDPKDDHNHGTHVSGTIGAHGNDGIGVVGVNWNVSIVGIKFLDSSGSGTLDNATLAIEYATKLGVTLTSNSWGGGGFSDTMQAAIDEANTKGILFVAAAGNDGVDNDTTPHYPGSYPSDNIISVAATDKNDAMASFSCFGKTTVDVGAPGVDILSSVPGATYATMSGTSMATPHVSGLAALIKSQYPDATAAQIKARILNTVDAIPALEGKSVSGGRINASSALENDSVPPNAARGLAVVDASTTSVTVGWQAAGDDGDVGMAKRYEVRTAATPIATDADWAAATVAQVDIVSAAEASDVRARISGLAFNSSGYLAIKAIDNVGNVGPMSTTLPFAVQAVRMIAQNSAEAMDGVTATGTWGLEAVTARSGHVFSDSPAGQYANNADSTLTMSEIALTSDKVALVASVAYDLEAGYDFGMIEVSADHGTTWVTVEKLTGTADWTQKTYDLSTLIPGATSLLIRFHVTSDYSVQKDGLKVDDIQVFAPQS